jgi:hypothetical protein
VNQASAVLVAIRSFLLGEIRGLETGLYVLGIVGGGSEREPREYSDRWAAIDDDPRGGWFGHLTQNVPKALDRCSHAGACAGVSAMIWDEYTQAVWQRER